MQSNSNYKDLLRLLNDAGVRYLVVGGYAVMKYTEPYLTKDLDIWIDPTPENGALTFSALTRFGAPLSGITVEDLLAPEFIYQLGIDYNRIHVMSHVDGGITFNDAWSRHETLDYDGIAAPVLMEDDQPSGVPLSNWVIVPSSVPEETTQIELWHDDERERLDASFCRFGLGRPSRTAG